MFLRRLSRIDCNRQSNIVSSGNDSYGAAAVCRPGIFRWHDVDVASCGVEALTGHITEDHRHLPSQQPHSLFAPTLLSWPFITSHLLTMHSESDIVLLTQSDIFSKIQVALLSELDQRLPMNAPHPETQPWWSTTIS